MIKNAYKRAKAVGERNRKLIPTFYMPEIRDITENTKGNAFLTAEAAFYLGCMKQQEFDRYHRRKGAR